MKSILFILSIILIFSCNTPENKKDQTQNSGKITDEEIMQNDSITTEILDNWLKLYIGEKEIVSKIGNPESKSKIEYWDATGTFVQTWHYASIGISLEMESESKNASKTIRSISIVYPCTFMTSRQIGIGSLSAMVKERYSGLVDLDFSDDTIIVVGSIYNGTIFEVENDSVTKIFIGSIAE